MNGAGRVRVALIGAGAWGLQHARVFAARQEVDLCAIVGRTPEKTRVRAKEFGANYYLDIQEMLDRERPDLVVVWKQIRNAYRSVLAGTEITARTGGKKKPAQKARAVLV